MTSIETIGNRTLEAIRSDFPILRKELPKSATESVTIAYLDNAATSQKPQSVIDAISSYYMNSNANVHRGVHRLSEEATGLYESARERVRQFIGAERTDEIVFTSGTTDSINLVAASLGQEYLSEGDVVLLTEMEHHSNLIPWQLIAKQRGVDLQFIPFDEHGELELDLLGELWSDRVKLVSVTHMSNVFGTINDIKRITRYAHERGALVLVDGAQAVPRIPVDVRDLDCDFYAFSGHKAYGPTGIGVLYGRQSLLESMPPYRGGGEMITSVWLDRATWNEVPYKFEAGTPNIAGAVGLGAAIEYVSGIGMDNIEAYERRLLEYGLKALQRVDGVEIFGDAVDRGAVISFAVDGVHPHDLAQILDGEGVAVRAGHHCAHPVMRKLGVPATARASFAFYTSNEEIDRLILGIEKAKGFFSNGI